MCKEHPGFILVKFWTKNTNQNRSKKPLKLNRAIYGKSPCFIDGRIALQIIGGFMTDVVIVDAIRTPIGALGGILSSIRPDDMGALVIKSLLERNDIDPNLIE